MLFFWIFYNILSLNVKMYLWLKLYTVPFFVSGQTCKISKGSNNYCYHDGHTHMGLGVLHWALWAHKVTQHRNATWNCIIQRGRHLFILSRNTAEFTGPEVIWDEPKDSGSAFSCWTSPHFSLFFGFYVPKMKKTIQTVTNKKCKKQPLLWFGGASVPTGRVICIYVKVPLMRRLMLEFWRDICCQFVFIEPNISYNCFLSNSEVYFVILSAICEK